jgi:hypothetical protein
MARRSPMGETPPSVIRERPRVAVHNAYGDTFAGGLDFAAALPDRAFARFAELRVAVCARRAALSARQPPHHALRSSLINHFVDYYWPRRASRRNRPKKSHFRPILRF